MAFEYDVAFSFLDPDERLAKELAAELGERYSTFVFSEHQMDLAGSDGLEKLTSVFRDFARLCVVLYRNGWGNTNWTRVEETAIKDRAFDKGWAFLLVISLDGSSPVWLPRTKLWLGFERFGLSAAAGAIDARIQELGGDPRDESPRERAVRLAAQAERAEQRASILRSEEGVRLAHTELSAIFTALQEEARELAKLAPACSVRFVKRDARVAMISSARWSIVFAWSQQWANSLNDSALYVRSYRGRYSFEGRAGGPPEASDETYILQLDAADRPVWVQESGTSAELSTKQLVDAHLKRLIDACFTDSD
jgi:hypothetical protein